MRSKILFAFIFLGVCLQSCKKEAAKNIVPGNDWKQMEDFPGGARIQANGFSIGHKGYITLGVSSAPFNDLWEYDAGTKAWIRRADFPGPGRTEAVCFVIGSKAYAGSGYSNGLNVTNDFYEYDPLTNTWTRKADFIYPSDFRGGISLSINGKGYVITGQYSKLVYEYDPLANTWTQKADFPGEERMQGVGFVIGNKGYVVGGNPGYATGLNECWEYDPAIDSWSLKAPVPEGIVSAVAFSINGNGFVGNGTGNRKHIWSYDPVTDKWEKMADFPGLSAGYAVSFVIDNSAYIATGDFLNELSSEVWRFVP